MNRRRVGSAHQRLWWAEPILFATSLPLLASVLVATAAAADRGVSSELADYQRHALTAKGNPRRGKQLFEDAKRTKCGICHRVHGEGGVVGPDLSSIGGKFDRPHLIESLLEPSRQIVEGYRSVAIMTTAGRVLTGIVKEQAADSVTILDAQNERQIIPVGEIERRVESNVSLMPDDLMKALTRVEFVDLIAYLETLRTGGKASPGANTIGPITLPAGFEIQTVATGLTGCTALETLRDGRVLLCEQTGSLRVVKEGRLLDQPCLRVRVDDNWERGLIGVTVDPAFPNVPFVYVCYVAPQPYPHHRVSRFRVDEDVADPNSETILLKGDDQTKLGGNVPAGHQGGALHFGPDGMLYLGIGEHTNSPAAQDMRTLQGKILRINPAGGIPGDNPFVDQTEGKYRAIWALGCRNPFTFAFRKSTGELFVNDVGGKFEEVNIAVAGANYGWPVIEHGPHQDKRFGSPLYWYPQASISGGDFTPDDLPWPQAFRGRYFFADFVHGWIKTLAPVQPENVTLFVSGLSRPVDLRFATDGSLYVLLRNAWVIDDKFQPGTGSLLRISYTGERRGDSH